jgi:hypothetical protein
MNKRGQAIIEALERQGIAVDIAAVKPHFETSLSTVRLRFDKVALRFIKDVQAALHEVVPDGKTLVFTITAPIRLASKTADALEVTIRAALAHRTARIDLEETINGNRIRVRLAKSVSNGANVIGFVHNPDSNPDILFDVTQAVLGRRER